MFRNLTFLIVFIASISIAHCQIFKGTVYDRSTDNVLSFAAVYISGTSIGTSADINGNFSLNISKYNSMPVTISLVGYYSVTLSEHNSSKSYDVYLTPKIKELNEVVVIAKNGNWKTYIRVFKREFLGKSDNAMDCDILNENALRFTYNDDSSTLSAFSTEPIHIYNKALGYSINYYLDKFNFSRQSDAIGAFTERFILIGNYLYKDELLTLSELEKKKVEERRRMAYLGSRMHFFRLLYEGNILQTGKYSIALQDTTSGSKGFLIETATPVMADSLVVRQDSISSYIKNKGEMNVRYRLKNSKLDIKADSVYFQKNGYYDPFEILFEGEMSNQRVGDLLPFEYVVQIKK